jgi:hypothetical protein
MLEERRNRDYFYNFLAQVARRMKILLTNIGKFKRGIDSIEEENSESGTR